MVSGIFKKQYHYNGGFPITKIECLSKLLAADFLNTDHTKFSQIEAPFTKHLKLAKAPIQAIHI